MKRLSQSQEAARAKLIEDLNKSKADIEDAVNQINNLIKGTLNVKVAEYNAHLAEAAVYRDQIVGVMDDHINTRSEKWMASDAGNEYETWKSDWENLELDGIVEYDEIEDPDYMTHGEELDGLPTEVVEV